MNRFQMTSIICFAMEIPEFGSHNLLMRIKCKL